MFARFSFEGYYEISSNVEWVRKYPDVKGQLTQQLTGGRIEKLRTPRRPHRLIFRFAVGATPTKVQSNLVEPKDRSFFCSNRVY